MQTEKRSLYKIVKVLNNQEEDGGLWLPNIQRNFVWKENKICKLFDSIMREYPISTLLVWRTKSSYTTYREFIGNYSKNFDESDIHVYEDKNVKNLVLDGQQRLQSLYIGIIGSFAGRELYLDILSGGESSPEGVKYKFEFRKSREGEFQWVKIKELVCDDRDPGGLANKIIDRADGKFSQGDIAKIQRNVISVQNLFHSGEGITYQLLDSINYPDLYLEDDVVEIFIRANSAGTVLSKSDLLFSLLKKRLVRCK